MRCDQRSPSSTTFFSRFQYFWQGNSFFHFKQRLISLSGQNIALNSQGFQDLSLSSPEAMAALFEKKFLSR
jgi:hypothetical protein